MAQDNRSSVYFDRDTNKFHGLDNKIMAQLRETYKGINVEQELSKMAIWLLSAKGKSRKGTIGFILNWLNNKQPSFGTTANLDLMQSDTTLGHLIREYLADGWKNNQHIYEFNTIRAST